MRNADERMERDDVLAWLEAHGSAEERAAMSRYGIPNERAFGVSVGELKRFARRIGRSHRLARELWLTGWYEARTLAAFVDEPAAVTDFQMDAWAFDFDSWAICDTVCFHLFDRTPFAWAKVEEWAPAGEEFVRRASYALVWALSVHDRAAPDDHFLRALEILEQGDPDPRTYVKKGASMALRAVGKRNSTLNAAAIEVARRLAGSGAAPHEWIGRKAVAELESEKVQTRLRG